MGHEVGWAALWDSRGQWDLETEGMVGRVGVWNSGVGVGRGARSVSGPTCGDPDPFLSLTQQESTGWTPTRAVLGMPSGFSATLQLEGKHV